MKISIIVPVYNVAPYILRCLQSIERQTCRDFECILIDDCGTDESMQLVEQFICKYDGDIQFSIVHHQQNMGISNARNTGIKSATGDYLYFIDSDDAITPDCIEVLKMLAEKYPDADFVQGNIVTGQEQLNDGTIDIDVPEYCNDKTLLEEIILCKTHRTAWNRLIKRSFLISNSLFFPEGIVMEDHYWTYFVSRQVRAAVFCHKGTYFYYKNTDSLINSPSKASLIKRYSSYIQVTDAIICDLMQRKDVNPYHSRNVGEALVLCMRNLAQLHSLRHWWIFWKFSIRTAYKLRRKVTWRRLCLFICMMPPFCFLTNIGGWRWRLRQYIIASI